MLRYSFDRDDAAKAIETAVEKTVASGIRTGDIKSADSTIVDTKGMGDAILANL
jgi:3-isopropylmalate dehydrogenase